jgi:hypothetical protein
MNLPFAMPVLSVALATGNQFEKIENTNVDSAHWTVKMANIDSNVAACWNTSACLNTAALPNSRAQRSLRIRKSFESNAILAKFCPRLHCLRKKVGIGWPSDVALVMPVNVI